MKTFLQIQQDVFNQLKEEKGDSGFWTQQEVKDAINDTYTFIADETLCFRLIFIAEIKAGIRFYRLPENLIPGSINRVEFDEEVIKPVLGADLDLFSTTWRDDTGDTLNYIPPGDISEVDEIGVYPIPDTDGPVYNLASTSKSDGVLVAANDGSYEEFVEENGTVVATDGEANFEQTLGVVIDSVDATDNLRIFAAKYPKLLYKDDEIFLPPIHHNPRKIITKGSMAILLQKEGEGKDIAKASYYNKRFEESLSKITRPKVKRMHRIRSITEFSSRGLNLGEKYPAYRR